MDQEEFEELLAGTFSRGVLADEPDETFVEGMVAPWSSEEGKRSLCRNAVATNTNHTTEIDYDAIDADLCCLWGADDRMVSVDWARRLVDDVGGEVVELDGYHWIPQDRPEEYVAELVRFLEAA
jgi:pimeloyl-ACP methyl ester carboxylesterase